MEFVNLTKHEIVVHSQRGRMVLVPSGVEARVETENILVEFPTGTTVDIFTQRVGEVEFLPEPKEGVGWVVSTQVRLAVPNRGDVFSPGELIRDEKGRPIGCMGLVRNF